MKFFHLSDLHIGVKLMNHDLREDQEYILAQIVSLAAERRPDAIVIAGDIYDRAVPSAEAVEVFDRFISALRRAVPDAAIMMISGNHDSAPRVNCYRSLLSEQNVYMIGMPPSSPGDRIEKAVVRDRYGAVNFYLLPFVRPSMVRTVLGEEEGGDRLSYDGAVHALIGREETDPAERNVIVSHQFYLPVGTDAASVERMDSEICTVGNIDAVRADALAPFDYAALGHIHKPMKVGSETVRYCGSPLALSVSEALQEKGILEVELREKGNTTVSVLPLEPLRRVRVLRGSLEDVLERACSDYVTVILTDGTYQTDLRDRLSAAFPNLLEIRREAARTAQYQERDAMPREMDPLELCMDFLKTEDPGEKQILSDVMNTVLSRAKEKGLSE